MKAVYEPCYKYVVLYGEQKRSCSHAMKICQIFSIQISTLRCGLYSFYALKGLFCWNINGGIIMKGNCDVDFIMTFTPLSWKQQS